MAINNHATRIDVEWDVKINGLYRIFTGMIKKHILKDAAKAIRFSYVAGVRNGEVIEAPITTEYRHALFQVIDLLAKIDLIYAATRSSLGKIIAELSIGTFFCTNSEQYTI